MRVPASVDHDTMKLGLLMESAQTQQELADRSLAQLQAHTLGLDAVVRSEIQRTLVEELSEVMQESTRAASSLRGLQRAAAGRVAGWSAALSVIPAGLGVLLWTRLLPSPDEVARLRLQEQQLAAAIQQLQQNGGRIDLRRCGEAARLCVRVDKRAPAYGEQADYLVVRGY